MIINQLLFEHLRNASSHRGSNMSDNAITNKSVKHTSNSRIVVSRRIRFLLIPLRDNK